MTNRRASGMADLSVEQGADEAAGVRQIAVASGAEERRAGSGLHEPEQRTERRGLAGAVRAEEADDRAALHRKADVQDGLVVAVRLRELIDRDDGVGKMRRGSGCHVRVLSKLHGWVGPRPRMCEAGAGGREG